MTGTQLKHLLAVGALAAAALVLAVQLRPTEPSMSERKSVTRYTDRMTTQCVGRFLIDVPPQAVEVGGNYEMQIAQVNAKTIADRPAADLLKLLDRDLAEREEALRPQLSFYHKRSMFRARTQPGPYLRTILYAKNDDEDLDLDGYIVKPGGVFEIKGSVVDDQNIAQLSDFLREVEPLIRVRNDAEIPKTPGFCIDNGFVAMNPMRGENVSWGWALADKPDVDFGFGSRTNGDDIQPGIVDREAGTLKEMGKWVSNMRMLRKRRITLAGVEAQEWAIAVTTSKPAYDFTIEIPGRPNDNAAPNITLGMRVGGYGKDGYVPPSLSEGEALALWDALIHTLRLRPGAV